MTEFTGAFVPEATSTASTEERYESWEKAFTKPQKRPSQFIYCVHSLASPMQRAIQAIALIEAGAIDNSGQSPDLEREPLSIAEKRIISSSIIDPIHRDTWSDAGLILQVPPENILAMYPQDAGTPWFEGIKLSEPQKPHLACTVQELLEQTSTTSYNEVVVQGETEAGKVEVIGFFIKIFSDLSLVNEELAKRIIGLSYRYGLPFAEILDSSPREPGRHIGN